MSDAPYPTPTSDIAVLMLARRSKEPGFIQFLADSIDGGFYITQPGDVDLTIEERRRLEEQRAGILCRAWEMRGAR